MPSTWMAEVCHGRPRRGRPGYADRAGFELQDRDERIIDLDLLAGDLRHDGPPDGSDLADLANEKARQVDVMRAQIAESAGAGDFLVQPPAEVEVRCR